MEQKEQSTKLELLKPRSTGQVIEDGLHFLRLNISPLTYLALRTIFPIIIILSLLQGILIFFMGDMFTQSMAESTQFQNPLFTGISGILYVLSVLLNFFSILVILSFNSTIIAHYALVENPFQELKKLTSDIWQNTGLMFLGVLISLLLMILMGIVFSLLIIPSFFADSAYGAIFISFIFVFIVLPFFVFAHVAGFLGMTYSGGGFFGDFFFYLKRGFSKFGKTWLVCFLTFLLTIVFSILPMVLISFAGIFGFFAGGAFEYGIMSFVGGILGTIIALISEVLSFAAFTLSFVILSVYYFTLHEEFEGSALGDQLNEVISDSDKN